MTNEKKTPRKSLTQVLNSLFWHFNQQPVPNYNDFHKKRARSASSTSIDRQVTKKSAVGSSNALFSTGNERTIRRASWAMHQRKEKLNPIIEE